MAVNAVKYDYFGSYSCVAVHGDPEIARLNDKNKVHTKVDTKITFFHFFNLQKINAPKLFGAHTWDWRHFKDNF